MALETFYAIFRCRPRKEIKNENILITGSGKTFMSFLDSTQRIKNAFELKSIRKASVESITNT